jgi:hypothetical protein
MNAEERLNLKKMLDQNKDYVDHTVDIRRVKHSGLLLDSLRDIEKLKRSNKELKATNYQAFEELCREAAPLMYKLYTDLFHKLVKDELNLVILIKLISVLELIEQERIDQNEGSAMVGKMLKEMYVDSAIRRGENLDKEREEREANSAEDVKREPAKDIRWRQWRTTNM